MSADLGRTEFFAHVAVSRETERKLDRLADLVIENSRAQNLVAASTMPSFWLRHMLDSAQVFRHAGSNARLWLDVGSGAGFPGLVLALLSDAQHTLVEPRRLRAEFLRHAASHLGLESRVTIVQRKVERVTDEPFDVVTARAVASLTATVEATAHLANRATQWLLHKGRSAAAEVAELRAAWGGEISRLPSVTDPEASIVELRDLHRSSGR